MNVGGQAPFETRHEAGFQFLDFAGAPVAGEDDLLSRFKEIVEGVEELFLDTLFAGEKLDVVDQQHVDVPVALAEFREGILLERLDELVGEFFRRKVGDPRVGVGAENGVSDGVHQVGLTEPGVTVEEQGVVGLGGGLRDGEGCGMSHLVIGPDDKGFEGVAGIERAGDGTAFVVSGGATSGSGAAAGGCGIGRAGTIRPGRSKTIPGVGIGLAQCHGHHATGVQAEALSDQIEVVVVNPNRREVIGHAKRHRIARGFEAHDGFEPHLENIFRKERLKVAFYGFPEAGREGQ